MHHAVDDYSRLAYSEILADERQEAAAGFWQRAQTCFADTGITVTAVMTDNGSCYRSRLFKATLGQHLKHRFTDRVTSTTVVAPSWMTSFAIILGVAVTLALGVMPAPVLELAQSAAAFVR